MDEERVFGGVELAEPPPPAPKDMRERTNFRSPTKNTRVDYLACTPHSSFQVDKQGQKMIYELDIKALKIRNINRERTFRGIGLVDPPRGTKRHARADEFSISSRVDRIT